MSIYILHIEDDNNIKTTMARLLRRNFEAVVVSVSSGLEAREVIGKHEWSAIISDWDINGNESGGDVYNMVQVKFPNLVPKYIFNSSNDKAELLATAIGAPYVDKPAEADDIIGAVKKVLFPS